MSEIKRETMRDDYFYSKGYEHGRADERAKHKYFIKADGSIHNLDEDIDKELQNFAQWLWDSHYLVNEAFTIRLVEQYKMEELKENK